MRDLAGARTWADACVFAADSSSFAEALVAEAGTRAAPHASLRAWALEQTAAKVNAPLWDRLRVLGVDVG